MMPRVTLSLALLAALAAAPAAAQEGDQPPPDEPTTDQPAPALPDPADQVPQALDGIAAVVGDSIVLRSQIDEQLVDMARSGQQLPTDPVALDRLRGEVLSGLIDELALVQAALRDSVIVSEDQIDDRVDAEIARVQENYRGEGGAAAMQAALQREGLTMDEYRRMLAARFRKRETISTYLRQVRQFRGYPPVTERDVREAYEARREQLGERPATVTFRQIVLAPEPSEAAREAALEEIRAIRDDLADGGDFAALARRHSDDPGSRERDGCLGWFRRGVMVKEFEDVAFRLRSGQTSGIVETPFGYHIIKVERAKGPERSACHILVRAEVTDQDRARAAALADSLAEALRQGGDLDQAIDAHHDASEESRVGPYPRDMLEQQQPAYAQALADAAVGDVVGPFELDDGSGGRKFAVVVLTDISDAGEFSFDEAAPTLRQQLQDQRLYEEVVGELRERMYVDVRL
jgi:peptidyl-prolyl cis-trans isomerase SurA